MWMVYCCLTLCGNIRSQRDLTCSFVFCKRLVLDVVTVQQMFVFRHRRCKFSFVSLTVARYRHMFRISLLYRSVVLFDVKLIWTEEMLSYSHLSHKGHGVTMKSARTGRPDVRGIWVNFLTHIHTCTRRLPPHGASNWLAYGVAKAQLRCSQWSTLRLS